MIMGEENDKRRILEVIYGNWGDYLLFRI